jgi:type I restriction enzyme, S subunit
MTTQLPLPAGWRRKRLRFVAEANPLKSRLRVADKLEVSFVPMDAVGEYGGLRLEETRQISDVFNGYTYFADGDVCVAKITPCFENGKGALASGLLNGIAFGTTELHVLRPSKSIDARFLFYVSISKDFRSLGEAEMVGAGGQKRVPEDFLKDWQAALPPLDVQQRIAHFLDQKTAQIDALIGKKRALLDRLAEKRQALVTRAVTRGLNPDVPMKSSCIEWLGQIPAHWGIRKIKFAVSHVVDCLHTTPNYDGDLAYPAVRTADIDRGRLLLDQVRLVSKEVYLERIQRLKPEPGDILYSREGERFGMAALAPEGIDLCLGQRMMMFRSSDSMAPTYFMWCLNSSSIYEQINLYAGGSTSPHVNIRDIINFSVPHPPLDEQGKIGRYIDNCCIEIERSASIVDQSVSKLVEYRSALITAAVNGKLPDLQ